jgi:hypothetical protein
VQWIVPISTRDFLSFNPLSSLAILTVLVGVDNMRSDLPVDGFRSFLKYLTLPELSILDLAILNREMRSQYLLALSGMIVKDVDIVFTSTLIEWLLQRNMFVKHVKKPLSGEPMQRLICRSHQILQSLAISNPEQFHSLLINFPNLHYLNLSNSQNITKEDFKQFIKLNPTIEKLNLSNVSGLFPSAVAVLESLPNLRDLDLSSNRWITDETLDSLSQRCLSLLVLNIRETDLESVDSMEFFLSTHPNLHYLGFDSFNFLENLSLLIFRSVVLNSLSSDCPKRQLLGLQNCAEIFSDGLLPTPPSLC